MTLSSWEALALAALPNAITSTAVMGADRTAVASASSCIGYPYFPLSAGFHTHLVISCVTGMLLHLSSHQEPSAGLIDPSTDM